MQGEALFMYQVWSLYYGEFLVLGIWGIGLALARRILFGELCKEAASGTGGKGRMRKAMTLRFEKSYEVKVGICDMQVFVRKYLCQEKRFGIPLEQWRKLPERWTGILSGVGFVETAALYYLGYDSTFCLNRLLAAATAAAVVRVAALWFESDSLWEQAEVYLMDYVSNTLYPRQMHVYEGFEKEGRTEETQKACQMDAGEPVEKGETEFVLEKEEERIFQEVLSDFLGTST